jgi:hypothetical protein
VPHVHRKIDFGSRTFAVISHLTDSPVGVEFARQPLLVVRQRDRVLIEGARAYGRFVPPLPQQSRILQARTAQSKDHCTSLS